MWTRLLYHSTLKDAFLPQLVKGKWMRPAISGRYRQVLKKEFRAAGVPWVLDSGKQNTVKINPRNKKPKGHKAEQLKIIKLEKIKKSLLNTDEAMLKYRQERLNNRRLKGNDIMFSQTIAGWMNFDREAYFESQKEAQKAKEKMGSDDEGQEKKVKKKGFKITEKDETKGETE